MSEPTSRQFNVYEAKSNLSRIIQRVEQGEEIIISRAGSPVAKIVPLSTRPFRTGYGSVSGKVVLSSDWDDPQVNDAIAESSSFHRDEFTS
jgi:prevent-host-death family protein